MRPRNPKGTNSDFLIVLKLIYNPEVSTKSLPNYRNKLIEI